MKAARGLAQETPGPIPGRRFTQLSAGDDADPSEVEFVGASHENDQTIGPGTTCLPHSRKVGCMPQADSPLHSFLAVQARRRGRRELSFQFHFLAHSRPTVS